MVLSVKELDLKNLNKKKTINSKEMEAEEEKKHLDVINSAVENHFASISTEDGSSEDGNSDAEKSSSVDFGQGNSQGASSEANSADNKENEASEYNSGPENSAEGDKQVNKDERGEVSLQDNNPAETSQEDANIYSQAEITELKNSSYNEGYKAAQEELSKEKQQLEERLSEKDELVSLLKNSSSQLQEELDKMKQNIKDTNTKLLTIILNKLHLGDITSLHYALTHFMEENLTNIVNNNTKCSLIINSRYKNVVEKLQQEKQIEDVEIVYDDELENGKCRVQAGNEKFEFEQDKIIKELENIIKEFLY